MSSRMSATVVLIVLAAGLAVRFMVPAGSFPARNPLPFPDDPPYHLMRLQALAEGTSTWPRDPGGRDPYVAWPYGDTCIWPWGFDLLAATTAPLASVCGPACMINAAGALPPLVSLLTAVLLLLLARKFISPGASALAVALFVLLPTGVSYSQAGRVDHHVMEPLLLLIPVLLLSGKSGRPGTRRAAAAGLSCGLGAAFFPAAPALCFPLYLIGGVWLAGGGTIPPAAAFSAGMIAGVTTSLAMSPFPTDWTFHSPSLWHLTVTCVMAAGLLAWSILNSKVLSTLSRRTEPSRNLALRAIIAAASIGISVAAGLALTRLFPELADSTVEGLKYTGASRFGALSLEATAFIDDPGRFMKVTGWILPLAAVGVFAMLGNLRRGRNSDTSLLLATTLAFITMGLIQRRFTLAATPFISISAAIGATALTGSVLPRIFDQARLRLLIMFGMSGLLLMPSITADLQMQSLSPLDRAMYSAAAAVRRDHEADTLEPPGGALTPWAYGHLFKFSGGVPTVCDNFFGIPGADAAIERCLRLTYAESDDEAIEMLEALRIRYVVVAPPHPEQVRAETKALGLDPDEWVDASGRLSGRFARSFLARAGMWAMGAGIGERGPFGLELTGRFRQIDASTGETEAEVFLLRRQTAER